LSNQEKQVICRKLIQLALSLFDVTQRRQYRRRSLHQASGYAVLGAHGRLVWKAFVLVGFLATMQGCFHSDSTGPTQAADAKKSKPIETQIASPDETKADQTKQEVQGATTEKKDTTRTSNSKDGSKNDSKSASKSDPESTKKQPPEKKYLDAQLHKNTTLLVLAYQPDIRADYLISNVRTVIDDQQYKVAKKLARQYDDQYKRILDERAAILEVATDEMDVEGPLLALRKQVADLNATIRMRISREVLTREQRKKVVELNKLR
jgi:hypothetical protein